jgi:hypothetical protein
MMTAHPYTSWEMETGGMKVVVSHGGKVKIYLCLVAVSLGLGDVGRLQKLQSRGVSKSTQALRIWLPHPQKDLHILFPLPRAPSMTW